MRSKTGQMIEDDVFSMVRNSAIASAINGGVYKKDTRPKNSAKEDIVVSFITAGVSSGDYVVGDSVQSGIVLINIYVPKLQSGSSICVKDISRCCTLEKEALNFVNSLTADKSDYAFLLAQTIYTEDDKDIDQNFVTIRLRFYILDI